MKAERSEPVYTLTLSEEEANWLLFIAQRNHIIPEGLATAKAAGHFNYAPEAPAEIEKTPWMLARLSDALVAVKR